MDSFSLTCARSVRELPPSLSVREAACFAHETMKPWEDPLGDTEQGIHDALSGRPARGGFVLCAMERERPVGMLVMLATGMQGYIPPNLLLFVTVHPNQRRRGIATTLIRTARNEVPGGIKLHVEPDNPARLLYEKIGFAPRYLDMRLGALTP